MSKNIFDFKPQTDAKSCEINTRDISEETKRNAENLLKKYEGYNQAQLEEELFRVASSEKQKGALSKEKLENIKQTIMPYLSGNQIDFLDNLIEKLDV